MSFEAYLHTTLDHVKDSRVKEAMAYALFANGKRVRPNLAVCAMRAYGADETLIYPFAAAIEMIHTYSLIHDDLPAMDDDTLRRGKPTCHVAFDEATAILAGDGLLTEAFYQATLCDVDAQTTIQLIRLLSEYAGSNGMILGQIYDLEAEHQNVSDVEQLKCVDIYKTGKLLAAPLIAAAYVSGHFDDEEMMNRIGEKLGLSFQIQDDILDVTSSVEVLGKNINSDIENEKSTYVSLLGIEKAGSVADACYEEAISYLKDTQLVNREELKVLFEQLSKRIS